MTLATVWGWAVAVLIYIFVFIHKSGVLCWMTDFDFTDGSGSVSCLLPGAAVWVLAAPRGVSHALTLHPAQKPYTYKS